jgi:hypothetical protein
MERTKLTRWLRRLWTAARAAHDRDSQEWTRRIEAPSAR